MSRSSPSPASDPILDVIPVEAPRPPTRSGSSLGVIRQIAFFILVAGGVMAAVHFVRLLTAWDAPGGQAAPPAGAIGGSDPAPRSAKPARPPAPVQLVDAREPEPDKAKTPPPRPAPPAHVQRTHVLIVESAIIKSKKADGRSWDLESAFAAPDPFVCVERAHSPQKDEVAALRNVHDELRNAQDKWKDLQSAEDRLKKTQGSDKRREFYERQITRAKEEGARPLTRAETQKLQDLEKQIARLRADYVRCTPTVEDSFRPSFQCATLPVGEGEELRISVLDSDLAFHDAIGETKIVVTRELIQVGSSELKFGQVESLKIRFQRTAP